MNIAILVDAENVLPSHADLIFEHAQAMGEIVRREIYGVAAALTTWVAPVLKYAIHPNLTIKASKGKNSSDIALVIGAMDLLVAGDVDCVVIASSDSDFSSLSVRLRNAGLQVVGMGTDKANALWRTACSSFIVLQNPKPAQTAKPAQAAKPAQQQPARQEAAPAEPPKQSAAKKPARPVASTHEERTAVIESLIAKRLESHGGRLQTSTLFPTLNKLPEYQVDRQGSGKKPRNYLTSTYGAAFHFEDTPDGKNWVSLISAEAEKPAEEEAPTETAAAEPEAVAEEAVIEETAVEQPAAEPERMEEAQDYATPEQIADRLVAGGFDPEIARQVTGIFADSTSYRAAYNKLRSVFGNNTGRDYYQSAKRILSE